MKGDAGWSFHNPVRVIFGRDALNGVAEEIKGSRYAVVTNSGEPFDGVRDILSGSAGAPEAVLDQVPPNPDIESLEKLCTAFRPARASVDVVVAVGGGSVIDATKVLVAAGDGFEALTARLRAGRAGDGPPALPIVAVPTTAGTGSEVTSWATVWDKQREHKLSLARSDLYPRLAALDPSLTHSLPRELTISTGLDALSHSLESLWNVNANPVSAELAIGAARSILTTLPPLLETPDDAGLRATMSRASLCAGLAFSNTKTALAHSLSYPLTLRHGLVHGVACSFTLPLLVRSVAGLDPDCDRRLHRILGEDLDAGADKLSAFLVELGVSTNHRDHGVTDPEWHELIDAAFDGERGKNFLGTRDRVVKAHQDSDDRAFASEAR